MTAVIDDKTIGSMNKDLRTNGVLQLVLGIVQAASVAVLFWICTTLINLGNDVVHLKANTFSIQEGLKVWQAIADVKQTVATINSGGSDGLKEFARSYKADLAATEVRIGAQFERVAIKLDTVSQKLTDHITQKP